MSQDIVMQIQRLENIVDKTHQLSHNTLGVSDPITKQALKTLLYLQGLKYDYGNLKVIQEAMTEAENILDI